jgi:hypothetical protein
MGTAANDSDSPPADPVGDPTAEFLPLVYEELRVIAAAYLANERSGHTLQPTAVVHEAYLRPSQQNPTACANKEHFLAIAARSMRQVLVRPRPLPPGSTSRRRPLARRVE